MHANSIVYYFNSLAATEYQSRERQRAEVLPTRSVDLNLARPFKAGKDERSVHVAYRRVKTRQIQLSLRDKAG
jgi:hypothetical protein